MWLLAYMQAYNYWGTELIRACVSRYDQFSWIAD